MTSNGLLLDDSVWSKNDKDPTTTNFN